MTSTATHEASKGWAGALPPERPGQVAPPALAAQRKAIAAAAASGLWRTDPPPRESLVAGVRVLRFDPPGAPRGVVLHLHGGAFRTGAPEVTAPYAAALAKRCGVGVVCPAYRLAPEHPFPAALRDGAAVLDALQQESAVPLVIAGDSAGAGLAATLTALAAARGRAPAGLVLLSAWLDLTLTSPDFATNAATDPVFSRDAAQAARALYLQGAPADAPLVSPLLGDLASFPPTLISVGKGEVLAGDGRKLHARLQAAGVASTLSVVPGMEHVAVTRSFELTGSRATFEVVARFIDDAVMPFSIKK